jgi:hypothetical protein
MHTLAQDGKFILYTLPFLWIDKNVPAISNDKVSSNFCLGGGFFLATATAVTVVVIADFMMLTSSSTD